MLPNGVIVWNTGVRTRQKMAEKFLAMAHDAGLNSIMVEGGSELASLFLESNLVNRVYLFYGNRILGNGLSGLSFRSGLRMNDSLELDEVEFHKLGNNMMVTGTIGKRQNVHRTR